MARAVRDVFCPLKIMLDKRNEFDYHFHESEVAMYICLCKGITESMVKGLAQRSVCPGELARKLGLSKEGCCGKCLRNIQAIASLASDASFQSEQI